MITTHTSIFAAAAACALALSAQHTDAITIDYASTTGATINFDGTGSDTFSFTNTPLLSTDLKVTDVVGGSSVPLLGSAVGDMGDVSGTFKIGTITSAGPIQTASVTGTGTMVISDGIKNLSGQIIWDSIASVGTGGTLNVNGVLNLTGVTYTGSQTDLKTLAAAGNGYEALTFQFVPGLSLTQLTTDGKSNSTSFSGTITTATAVPDNGPTLAFLGSALLGLAVLNRKSNQTNLGTDC